MDDGAKFCAKCGGIAPESEAHTADGAYVPEIPAAEIQTPAE